MVERVAKDKLVKVGQVYRHRKHDPSAGHCHEYTVVGIVEPWPEDPSKKQDRTHWIFPNQYRHTATRDLISLTGCAQWIYADVDELHVAYKNTQPDRCDPNWVYCLRPLREFVDGRFRLMC